MVKIPGFHYCGPGSIPGEGTEIPQAMCGMAKKKRLNWVNETYAELS